MQKVKEESTVGRRNRPVQIAHARGRIARGYLANIAAVSASFAQEVFEPQLDVRDNIVDLGNDGDLALFVGDTASTVQARAQRRFGRAPLTPHANDEHPDGAVGLRSIGTHAEIIEPPRQRIVFARTFAP
jgi:hypothetical protein